MKKYTWCFAGQIHAQVGRAKMIESLKKCNGEYHLQVNKGWQSKDSLGAQDYRGVLSDSIFVPCPRGNSSVDTFRLYEALEVGVIPIVEKSDYWENLLGEHPLIETDCWDGIHKDINLLLENKEWIEEHSKKIQKWWSDYKISLKTKIKNIILDQKEEKPTTTKEFFVHMKDEWTNLVDKDTFSEWVEDSNFKASFSCYNPGHKIGIVSLYTPEIESYAIYSELNIREYCEKQGYTFYVYRDSLDKSSHGNWSKAKALLNHIDDHEEIIWMDSDIVIYNPEKKFEDILSRCVPIKKVIACEDIGSNNKNLKKGSVFNSGVVIFRKHEYTKNILKRWWNFRLDHDTSDLYSEGGDQEVLIDILKKSDPFGHNYKVFPMNTFNTEPRFVDDDTFVLHFMAYPRHLKDFFIKHFYFNEAGVKKTNEATQCNNNFSHRHFTLVQIGAHNGSKIKDRIIQAYKEKKNVLLIEPVPYLFNELKKSFGGYKNIFLDDCAISDSNESKDLFYVETKNLHDKPPWTSELNSFNKSHILNHNFHAESKKEWSEVQESEIKSISLECKTFLDLCLKHGISSIDLLQVDTEGHDFNILKTLNPKGVLPKKIIFERKHMDGTFKEGEKYKDLVLFLNGLGYSVSILDKENSCAELTSNKQKNISPEHPFSTEEIDICFCCDHNIVHYIPVVLNSILHKNPSTPINVHLLYNGDKHNISVVENYFKDKPFLDFYFYDSKIPKSNLQSDPDNPHFLGHVTNASHLKYLIPETLSHLNRVIYLDIDLIAPINLKLLHSFPTGPKGIAMRNEIHNGWLNINGKQAGNSGVMVMNLEKLRSLNFTESCLEIPNPVNHEQNVINLFCEGLHGRLDDHFNIYASTEVAEVHSIDSLNLYPLKTQETKEGPRNYIDVDPKNRINVSNGYILHYTASKPWNPKSKNSALWHFFKNYKIKNF